MAISNQIQQVLDAIDYSASMKNPIQIKIQPGDYYLTAPLVITKRVDIDARGCRFLIDHDGDGIVFGTDQQEPYHSSWIGGRITTKAGWSKKRGVVLYRSNFVTLRHVHVDRFDVGFCCNGNDPVDVYFDDCYSNGCRIGYFLNGSNVTTINGGKVTGDTTMFPDSTGIVVLSSAAVTISGVDCSIHKTALSAINAGGLKAHLYTERIGSRAAGNDDAVITLDDCRQVEISGIINAVGGASGLPFDCRTGVDVRNSHGVVINGRFLSCREREVFAVNSTVVTDGSTAENSWNGNYDLRVISQSQPSQVIPVMAEPVVAVGCSWNGTTLSVGESVTSAITYTVPYSFRAGRKYELEFLCHCESKGPSTSTQSAVRVRLRNGTDNSTIHYPMTSGTTQRVRCQWTPKSDYDSAVIEIGSRANPIGQVVYGSFVGTVSGMRFRELLG